MEVIILLQGTSLLEGHNSAEDNPMSAEYKLLEEGVGAVVLEVVVLEAVAEVELEAVVDTWAEVELEAVVDTWEEAEGLEQDKQEILVEM